MNYQTLLASQLNPLWAPPPDLKPSQWAEEFRYLSSEASAVHGKWHNDKIPYCEGILDACMEPDIDTVVIMSAAQLLKTEILLNLIGYFIDLDPSPILVVQPTTDMGESFSRERLSPMIRDTPRLTGLVAPPGSKASGNTILKKAFSGGQIVIAGANSTASLSSRPVRVLLADEIDRWPEVLGKEGDPLKLAEKRTDAFFNRLKVYTSTPTQKGRSRIEMLAELSDKRMCHVPCPHCGVYQPLVWPNLRWDKGKPETAYYACADCREPISEHFKAEMLAGYKWVKTAESKKIAGFVELNTLYSPWQQWSNMVENWLEAQGRPELLKTFVNLFLAQCWEEKSEKMSEGDLSKLAAAFSRKKPLEDTLFFTAGVDVQGDRLEVTICGWNVRQAMYIYETFVVLGDPSTEPERTGEEIPGYKNVYKELAETLAERYGEKLAGGCIDAGYATEFVHKNTARYLPGFTAIKGEGGPGKPLISDVRYAGAYKAPWRMVGVDGFKDAIKARIEAGNESIRFSKTLPPEWYDQLTAEQVYISTKRSFPVREWRKVRQRNEALDCVIYSWAAVYVLRPDWAILEAERTAAPVVDSPPPRKRPRRSSNFATDWR